MKKVYLIFSEESGFYKIGTSKYSILRLYQLQTGNPEKLRLIIDYPSKYANSIEKALHRTYFHIKKEGEWFKLSLKEELNFINDCKKIENNIIIVKDIN